MGELYSTLDAVRANKVMLDFTTISCGRGDGDPRSAEDGVALLQRDEVIGRSVVTISKANRALWGCCLWFACELAELVVSMDPA